MRTRLLLATLLVATFCCTRVHADMTLEIKASGGEHTMLASDGGTHTTDASGNQIWTKTVADHTLVGLYEPMRAGYTFHGWKSNYVTALQANLSCVDVATGTKTTVAPTSYDIVDFSKTAPFSLEGHKYDKEITVNFWAYMDDWSKYLVGGTSSDGDLKTMKMVSCTQSGGWNIAESDADGNIKFIVRSATTDKYVYLILKTKWTALAPGWHMFTLTYDDVWATAYLDGGGDGTTATRITQEVQGGIKYADGVYVMVGAEPSATNGAGSKFTGKIRNLVITKNGYARDGIELPKADLDAMIKSWYDNPGRVWVDSHKETDALYPFSSYWVANPEQNVTMNKNGGVGGSYGVGADNTIEAVRTQKVGVRIQLNEPTRLDHVFSHWSGAGADYVSKYQNLVPAFSHPTALQSERTNIVTFDGTSDYYAISAEKKWTDCFTVNIWASMTNWEEYATGDMRLFSCTQTGGFNIQPSKADATGCIKFVGYDAGHNAAVTHKAYKSAASTVKWSSLSAGYHMFTYVFDGRYVRGYLDGELIACSEPYVGAMHYNETNSIIVGAEAGDGAEAVGQYFRGEMRDLCLIHTALPPSYVKDLHENPGLTKYFFAPSNVDIVAEWTPLPLLSASPVTIVEETFVNEPTVQEVLIMGNGITVPTVSVEGTGWTKLSESLNEMGGSIMVQYNPTAAGTHEGTIIVRSTYSSDQQAIITGKAYSKLAVTSVPTSTHVWVGESFTQDITIVGDGHQVPDVTLSETTQYSLDNSLLTADGGVAKLTYAPTAAGEHKTTFTARSSFASANKQVEAICYAHQFEVAYWEKEAFVVKMDAALAASVITFNEQVITLTANEDGTYIVPFADVENYAGQTLPIIFTAADNTWNMDAEVIVPTSAGSDETTAIQTGTIAELVILQDVPLQIRIQGLCMGDEVRIFSSNGKLVYQSQASTVNEAFSLPTAGTYCIQALREGNMRTKTVTVY